MMINFLPSDCFAATTVDAPQIMCLNRIVRVTRTYTILAAVIALALFPNARSLAADTNNVAPVKIKAKAKANNTAGGSTLATGWYGPGWDGGHGYFNPARTPQYNPYPYYNIVGGEPYGAMFESDLPDQNESPYNPAAALTRHAGAATMLHDQPNYITGP
jgi:hypothetical protein